MESQSGTEIAHMKSADARQKRWGKRFRSVLAEIAGREFGGPPHRTPDLFSFSLSFPNAAYVAATTADAGTTADLGPAGAAGMSGNCLRPPRDTVEERPFQGRVEDRLRDWGFSPRATQPRPCS